MWKLLLISAVTVFTTTTVTAKPVELDKVVVVVNNGVILQSDVDIALKMIKLNARASKQALPSDAVLRKQVVDKLILNKIQLQKSHVLNFFVILVPNLAIFSTQSTHDSVVDKKCTGFVS